MKPTRLFIAILAVLAIVALAGCSSVSRLDVAAGATSQGELSGSVQIYFRDAAGQLQTARVPRALVAGTNAAPVASALDLPTGESLPTIPR